MIYKKKKETEGKIYSPSGKFAERAKNVLQNYAVEKSLVLGL